MNERAQPAGFRNRAMAFIIDMALLTALHCGFFLTLAVALTRFPPARFTALLAVMAAYALLFLLMPFFSALTYCTVLHACGGQTVGKIFMDIKVVTVGGGPVPPGTAFLRWVGTIVSALPMGAGFLWAAVDRHQATWHDKLAGTMVIANEQTA